MENILEAIDLCKIYGNGTAANKHVDFSVRKGEIIGLVGENGAGKSTLMKVLYGEEAPTSGTLKLEGEPVVFGSSRDAIAAGIGMVHQHFMLVPSLSLAENLVLGREPKKRGSGFFDLAEAVRITEELSAKFNLKIFPRARVVDVSVSMRQKLEILKTLYRGARILILDEPTAVLTPQETDELFMELKELKKKGQTIIFISHKLGEVFNLCDRVTVMRDGAMIATHDVADVDRQTISNEMVGREVHLTLDKRKASPGEALLVAKDLSYVDDFGITMVDRVSFSLRRGEILGVVGVDGNGQSELVRILTGSARTLTGSVRKGPVDLTNASPRRIRLSGMAHVAEDRMTVGTALPASIADNILADRYSDPEYTGRGGFLKPAAMAQTAKKVVKQFDIRCSSPNQPVASLSGGNMQKVVIGREFTAKADVLIVSQPTRGVDVGAIEFIHKTILSMRDAGKAILLVSSDLGEVTSLSDSLVVMNSGRIVAYFPDASSVTDKELGLYMLGLKQQDETDIRKVLHE
ncbi:MAG: ABC transporter ATP-binding protein [Rectinemataceae bacterium]|nr:ABC transporter ATP-binding protein [Rectinemataceae bacterium]